MRLPPPVAAAGLAALASCGAPGRSGELPSSTWTPTPQETGAGAGGGGEQQFEPLEVPDELTLARTLELAASASLSPQVARARAEAARGAAAAARAARIPELFLGGSFWRNEGEVQATVGTFLDVDKQNTFLGGGVALRLDLAEAIFGPASAEARAEAAEVAVRAREADALAAASAAWYDLAEAEQRRSIADEAVAHATELVGLERAHVEEGSGLAADLAQARAYLARARGARVEGDRLVAVAAARLAELLLLAPAAPLRTSGLEALPAPGSSGDLEALLQRAAAARPELEQARHAARAAAEEASAAAKAWWLPTFELGAAVGGFGQNPGNLEDSEVYAAALTWDLGLRLFGQSDEARAHARAAQIEERMVARRVAAEVVAAEATLRAARAALEMVADEIAAAEEGARLARERHAAGAGLFVEVLEAEVSLVRARVSEAAARVELQRAWTELRRAVGSLR